jgi:hypothetical protein
MSGETEKEVSGWTTDTLHSHLITVIREHDKRYEQRFQDQEKATINALASANTAVHKAEVAADKRFELLNELKAIVIERDASFMTRTEAEYAVNRNSERIQDIAGRMLTLASKDIVAAECNLINKAVTEIGERVTRAEGLRSGYHAGWGYLFAAITAIAALVTIYIALRH